VEPARGRLPAQVRVAALDLGTNTTRLLVADVEEGSVNEIVRRSVITRLGDGVDERRRLLPLPITRVRNVLADYRRELEGLGAERALLVATSAVRDAENGEAFLGEIEWSYGFTTQLATGDEEGELTFRGVGAQDALVLDVGGGSTELVDAEVARSFQVGSARMTDRFGEDIEAIAAHVRSTLPSDLRPQRVIGVAATITTLAALDLALSDYSPDLVHGHVLTHESVERQLERLAALPLEERRRVPALEPERAPVIVAGATIVREAMRALDVDALEVSVRDLLDGIALEAAALPAPEEGAAPPGAYTCC
jgi:exopolyphosphatase/guanosine-5'-triphosphate,3'-diphosphate pyrophosphatase